jgi:16S rRNA (uracil1498-N3)-methyltransferase
MSLVPYVHLDVPLADLTEGAAVTLPPDAIHHLTRVLRLAPGAPLQVADGVGWQAAARFADGAVTLRGAAIHVPAPRPSLVVAQALAKGRKLDEVVRQVTELGADGFVALRTARSVVSLDAARQAKVTGRWRQVAWSASEQARRPTRPFIAGPVAVDDLPHWSVEGPHVTSPDGVGSDPALLLVAHPGGRPLPDVLADHPLPGGVTVAIGPEGGFDDDEVARLESAGAVGVGLGPSVLRTEHAAAAAVAACAALLGRWG